MHIVHVIVWSYLLITSAAYNIYIYIYAPINRVIVGSGNMGNGLSPDRHYLNQGWPIVNWTPEYKFQWNLNHDTIIFIPENAFGNVGCQHDRTTLFVTSDKYKQ